MIAHAIPYYLIHSKVETSYAVSNAEEAGDFARRHGEPGEDSEERRIGRMGKQKESNGEDGEAKGVKWGGLNTAMRVDRAGMREGVC